jgi:hypothetical protein
MAQLAVKIRALQVAGPPKHASAAAPPADSPQPDLLDLQAAVLGFRLFQS